MNEVLAGQMDLFAPDTYSGKTSWGLSAPALPKEPISRRSSKKSSRLQKPPLVCVCVYRTEDGQNPGATTLKMEAGVLPGVPTTLSSSAYLNGGEGLLSWPISMDSPPHPFYLTMNIGEKPREPNPTRLSEILEENPDPKYSLTAKACEGILRRSERRGKPLPSELKEALIAQSASKATESTEPTPPDATGADGVGGGAYTLNTIDRPAVYAENQGGRDGGGKGPLIQVDKSATVSTLQDQTLFVPPAADNSAQRESNRGDNGELDEHHGGHGSDPSSARPEKFSGHSEPLCLDHVLLSGGTTYQGRGYYKNVAGTLKTAPHGVMAVDVRNGTENPDVNGTLQAKGNGGISLNCNNVIRTSEPSS